MCPIDWSVNQLQDYRMGICRVGAYPWPMALLAEIGIQGGYAFAALTLLVLPIAASACANSGPAWESLGGPGVGIEKPLPPAPLAAPPPPVDPALQATEARQMLEAKSYRRRQRGEAPLDVEAELERLLASTGGPTGDLDEKLRAEVRLLVVARNERRMRTGAEPLDVEAETERQVAEFAGLGR
jgi:hypothetical protein